MTMHNNERGVDAARIAQETVERVNRSTSASLGLEQARVIHLGLSPRAARAVRRALDVAALSHDAITAQVIREIDVQLGA
jgi:hypothetical protein